MKVQKNIIFLLYSTLFLVVAWIASSVYHELTTSSITNDLNMIITPISNTFSQTAISNITNRKQVTPLYTVPIKQTINQANNLPTQATASANITLNAAQALLAPTASSAGINSLSTQ